MARFSRITGTGSFLPPRRLGNAELACQDMSTSPLALESLEEIRRAASRATSPGGRAGSETLATMLAGVPPSAGGGGGVVAQALSRAAVATPRVVARIQLSRIQSSQTLCDNLTHVKRSVSQPNWAT